MNKGEFLKALEHYQQALQVSLTYLPPQHTDLAPLYDSIGKSYFEHGDYQKAVENFERAADLISQSPQSPNDRFVNELNTRIDSAKRLLSNKH